MFTVFNRKYYFFLGIDSFMCFQATKESCILERGKKKVNQSHEEMKIPANALIEIDNLILKFI